MNPFIVDLVVKKKKREEDERVKKFIFLLLLLTQFGYAEDFPILGLGHLPLPALEAELEPGLFSGISLLHLKGDYLLQGLYMERSMQLADNAKAKVALNLIGSRSIEKYRERLLGLIETYTDILFLNEQEARDLTRLPPGQAARFLNHLCPVVVIGTDRGECWICSKKEFFLSKPPKNAPAPSSHSYALFTSAFLYGYLFGCPLKTCAHFAQLATALPPPASEKGLSYTDWEELRKKSRAIKR